MDVVVFAEGLTHSETPAWPQDWQLPRPGDVVKMVDGTVLIVNGVQWLVQGERLDEDDPTDVTEPFVWLHLQKIREDH